MIICAAGSFGHPIVDQNVGTRTRITQFVIKLHRRTDGLKHITVVLFRKSNLSEEIKI